MSIVRYGSEIVLKHATTGQFLSSPGVAYSHQGSSKQDQVTCIKAINSKCYWIVKPPHGYSDDYLYGQQISRDSIIRLENRASCKNLHSHVNAPSPISKQGEVTCYVGAVKGKGDFNDNWWVELEGTEPLKTGSRFRLTHTSTGYALHSHNSSDPTLTSGQQEVTGYMQRDHNDFWIVDAAYGPLVPPQFSSHAAASNWLSVVHLAASIASISGITLLFLGATLKSVTLAKLLSTVFAVSLNIGIASIIGLLLLQIHRVLKLRLRVKLWIFALWTTGIPLGASVVVFICWVTFKHILPILAKLLGELFGP
jgi:hypothetical protein